MELLKKIHRNNDEIDFKSIWEKGVFIFDSNVLLDLYRLPVSAREDLINVFENDKFKDRIWIGFQVLLEFLNNRLEVISDQKNKFTQVKKIIQSTITQYEDNFSKLNSELKHLKLSQRHSLIDPEKYINDENISQGKNFLNEFIAYLDELEKKQFDVNENDIIKEKVLSIFSNKSGVAFDKESLEEIYLKGDERYKNQVPPGYMDIKKEGYYPYQDKKFIRKFGDFLLWKEIIEKCKTEKLEYAVLVTGDVKEDWWQKKRGKKLGARMELLNEIYSEANELETFYMYDTSSFLQYAKQEIDENIKESSISETKELIELSNQEREITKKQKVLLKIKQEEIKKELKNTEHKIKSLKNKIAENKEYLNKISNHRTNIYTENQNNEEANEYAHNLGYLESEQEEEREQFIKQLKEFENHKKELLMSYFTSKIEK